MKLKYIYLLKLLITKQNNFKRSFIMNFTKKNYEILLFFWKNNYIFGFNVISQHKILVFLKTTKLNYIKTLKISPFFFSIIKHFTQ